MEKTILNAEQIMEYLNVSRVTLRRLIADGLPHLKIGGTYRFRLESVDSWIADQEAKLTKPTRDVEGEQ